VKAPQVVRFRAQFPLCSANIHLTTSHTRVEHSKCQSNVNSVSEQNRVGDFGGADTDWGTRVGIIIPPFLRPRTTIGSLDKAHRAHGIT
jgi:hypothetical protein